MYYFGGRMFLCHMYALVRRMCLQYVTNGVEMQLGLAGGHISLTERCAVKISSLPCLNLTVCIRDSYSFP
jgi:hypothetical protein